VTRLAVLRYSIRGIFGAAMLGLGRALGETMAVTMVIGNSDKISALLLSPGNTLASKMAAEYGETPPFGLHLSALVELGLILLLVTLTTNMLARLLIGAVGARQPAGTRAP
jgi:phosphate transport system permease protein